MGNNQKIMKISKVCKVLKPQNPCSRVGAVHIYTNRLVQHDIRKFQTIYKKYCKNDPKTIGKSICLFKSPKHNAENLVKYAFQWYYEPLQMFKLLRFWICCLSLTKVLKLYLKFCFSKLNQKLDILKYQVKLTKMFWV